MAKVSTVFVCSNCGNESPKWLGKCPACNEWNSFYEEKVGKASAKGEKAGKTTTPTLLNDVKKQESVRVRNWV